MSWSINSLIKPYVISKIKEINKGQRPINQTRRSNNQQQNKKWRKPRHGEIEGNCDANLTVE
jgi:hypothetical protein